MGAGIRRKSKVLARLDDSPLLAYTVFVAAHCAIQTPLYIIATQRAKAQRNRNI
jgi:hypothetical protein